MKRYMLNTLLSEDYRTGKLEIPRRLFEMIENPHGKWVTWEDHQVEVERLHGIISGLKDVIRYFETSLGSAHKAWIQEETERIRITKLLKECMIIPG